MNFRSLTRMHLRAPTALVPLVATLAFAPLPAVQAAGPIYRCGNEYSQTPCPGGAALPSSDSRSEAQRAEAVRVAAQDKRRAAEMQRERIAEAKRNPPSLAVGIHAKAAKAETADSKAPGGKSKPRKKVKAGAAAPTDFVAVPPAAPKKAKSTP